MQSWGYTYLCPARIHRVMDDGASCSLAVMRQLGRASVTCEVQLQVGVRVAKCFTAKTSAVEA